VYSRYAGDDRDIDDIVTSGDSMTLSESVTEARTMPATIDAPTLKAWLSDAREIALFDVQEHGRCGASHLFFSVPLPYSRFEFGLPKLAPNVRVRTILCDGGDGVAERAAARAAAIGYRDVFVLAGGTKAGPRRATRSMKA
jgi:rhodanese-related sulfurtransferase